MFEFSRNNRSFLRIVAIGFLSATCSATCSMMLFGCGKSGSNAPITSDQAPSIPTPPTAQPPTPEELLSGRWRQNECILIQAGAYKNHYQAKVMVFTPTSSEVMPTVYVDKHCKKPAIQFQTIATAKVKIVPLVPGHPDLIGLDITPKGSETIKYTSVLIKDDTLRLSTGRRTSDGTTSDRRAVPSQNDPIYTKEKLPPEATVDGNATLSIKTIYQSDCVVLKNEEDAAERCTLQFNQENKKMDFHRLGFADDKCTIPKGNSTYLEPIEYETLKLSNLDDSIYGYATKQTGYIVQFRIHKGAIYLEGVLDGSDTLTLTELEQRP